MYWHTFCFILNMAQILIIDDDKLIRWSLKELFTKHNHQVHTASTAKEALILAEKSPYQLIFTDLELNQETRIDILPRIKDIQPNALIIILSALNQPKIEQQLGDLKVDAVIEKPFSGEDILNLVNELFKSKKIIKD